MEQTKSSLISKIFSVKFLWFIILILGLGLMFMLKYNKHEKIEYRDTIVLQKDTVFYYKDMYDIEHARVQTLEASMSTVSLIYGSKMDSITKELSITKNQIQSILEITSQTTGNIKTKVETKYVDSNKFYTFNYDDSFMKIDGTVGSDSADINYEMTQNLRAVGYQKRSGFLGLGRKKTYVDIKSDNPKAHISKAEAIQLPGIKEKMFSVGPTVGYFYNGTNWKPGVGLSLQWRLIKF